MRLFVIVIVTALATGCQRSDPNQAFLQAFASQVAAPNYQTLVEQTQQLHSATQQCDSQNLASFVAATQGSWAAAMSAWQTAKIIRFGPVVEQRIDWEFQFWPDKKNLVAKKARPLLKQSEAISDQQMAKSSVVLHGLSALEFLLYDPAVIKTANPDRYCEAARWIGQAIAEHAKVLDSAWALLQPDFIAPSENSDHFASAEIAVAKILDSYLVTLEELTNRKIAEAIGEDDNARLNPYFLESWRSQHSWQNMQANLAAVNALFGPGGFSQYLQDLGFSELNTQLSQQMAAVNQAAAGVSPPLFSNLKQQAQPLRALQQELLQLRSILEDDITDVLDLPVGFNDQDGD